MSNRVGRAQRSTSESQISVVIDLDGTGRSDISTRPALFRSYADLVCHPRQL